MARYKIKRAWFFIGIGLLLCGCSLGSGSPPADLTNRASILPTATFTPFQPISPAELESAITASASTGTSPTFLEPTYTTIPALDTLTPRQSQIQPTPTDTFAAQPTVAQPPVGQLTIWIDPHLPAGLHNNLLMPPQLSPQDHSAADTRLQPGQGRVLSHWIYALVAPFPTLTYGVSSEDLINNWRGGEGGQFGGSPLLMDESTYHMISALWGEPASGAAQVLPDEDVLIQAWETRPSWAIVPFEALEPRWKVLEIDGQSPLRNDFDPAAYALNVPISLGGATSAVEILLSLYGPGTPNQMLPNSNRDPDRMTVLAMTGVTALVRATAYAMELHGVLYPGIDVRDWLRSADLTHISNEVPFATNCPYPNPVQQDMRFCSDPRYIALLEDVGTDIVELTGDHFADWGAEAMYYTLDLYGERGWPYYGGGADLHGGRQAVILEHNGNRLAFIGCNAKGSSFAQAGPDYPGAVVCDLDWMGSEIERLRGEGYLPIVTFQHYEYYTYQAQKPQIRDSRLMADAGAVIVSGSQAHQPQAFEFTPGAFIHYGLGNLFFDQYDVSYPTRQAFIDRHVFYDGRHIGTELLPILFIDYARPRPMTPVEREELLQSVFSASGY